MTQIAKREQASMMVSLSERWGVESDQLIPITKATIFKADAAKVSDPELIAFLMVCSRYDLNPFLRQIHAYYDRRGGCRAYRRRGRVGGSRRPGKAV